MNTIPNPIQLPTAERISLADTAKLVRQALKKAFPNVKFSVKSQAYSGGASITVSYDADLSWDDVKKLVNNYKASGFDGGIDLQYDRNCWLAPDGSATRAYSEGTRKYEGFKEGYANDPHAAGCRYVRFGADFIFVRNLKD